MADKRKYTKKKTGSKKDQFVQLGGRVPPHSLEMERAVLCSALIDPDGFARIVDYVDEDSYYDRRHQLVHKAMASLFSKAAPIDSLTVSDELEGSGDLEAAGGDPYLAGLSNEVATAAHAEQYAKTVREKYSLRRLINTTTSAAIDAYDAPESFELLDRTLKDLFDIYSNRREGGFEPLAGILQHTSDYLDKYKKSKDEITGVSTGFTELDKITSGFQPGDLVIIAGRPSMGKTAFSLDLACHACLSDNTAVAFFSLEMASMAIAMRLLASSAKIDLHKLRSGNLTNSQWKDLTLAVTTLSGTDFFIDDTGTLGLMELRARARQFKQQHDIGIIFIDYLQLMRPPKAESREQEVAQISRALKGLARELEVPVIAMSQLSRAVEQRGGDKRPVLSDLRDSGSIEQDADVVMFIYRERLYKSSSEDDEGEIDNTAEIIIRKQRNGPTGTVKLTFVPEYARFVDQADEAAVEAAQSFEHVSSDDGSDEGMPF